MKPPYLMLCGALLALAACGKYEPETKYYPVLMKREQLETSVTFKPATAVNQADKLLYNGSYLYILERTRGVHIIDNSNAQNPVNHGFITVPGCMDIIIKDNVLYADNSVDLVAINIGNIAGGISVAKRIINLFPDIKAPDGYFLRDEFKVGARPANTVIVGWEK